VEFGGERNRAIYVLKCRGTAHSNQIREFVITSKGIKLVPVYIGPEGVLAGSARLSQEARAEAVQQAAKEEKERQQLALDHRRKAVEAQVEALRAGFAAEQEEFARIAASRKLLGEQEVRDRASMALSRKQSNGT